MHIKLYIKSGFELAIVVKILLSGFYSKDWNVKRGGDSQTP